MSLPVPGGRLPRWQLALFSLAIAAAGCGLVSWGALGAWQGLTENAGSAVTAETSVAVPITSIHCSGAKPPYSSCADTSGDVQLLWSAVAGSPGITVFRASSPSGPFSAIASLPGTATGYTDATAAYNSQYYYEVGSGAPGWHPNAGLDMALSLPPTGGVDATRGSAKAITFTAASLQAMSVQDGVTYTTVAPWGGRAAAIMANATIYSVSCISTTTCWAAGAGGAMWTTTDGGATWTQQTLPGNRTVYSVDFLNASVGWAVGSKGAIYSTTDGGTTWTRTTQGGLPTLNAVDFVNPNDGWAVGQGGTILATTNGSASAVMQSSGTTATLYGISCVSSSQCWVVGQGGTILSTSDGGAAWTVQTSGTANQLNAVAFENASDGLAVGQGGIILATTDGGATWTRQVSGTTQNLLAISMVSSTTGWAVGAGGTILHTTDGGATWAAQASGTTQPINAVSAASSSFAVVGLTPGGGTPSALVTTDGGVSWGAPPSAQYVEWTFSPTVAPAAPVTGAVVTLVDGATATPVAGTTAALLISADGGSAWSSFPIATPSTALTTQVVDVSSAIGSGAAVSGMMLRYVVTGGNPFRSVFDLVHVDIN